MTRDMRTEIVGCLVCLYLRIMCLSLTRDLVCRVSCVFLSVLQPKPVGEGLANRTAKPAGAAGTSIAKRCVRDSAFKKQGVDGPKCLFDTCRINEVVQGGSGRTGLPWNSELRFWDKAGVVGIMASSMPPREGSTATNRSCGLAWTLTKLLHTAVSY